MKRSVAALLVLLAVSAGVQAWCIRHAVTPALDAVRYISVARQFASRGLPSTLEQEVEHPLFPGLIWVAHSVGSRFCQASSTSWTTAAQITAAALLVLAVVPVFQLLRITSGFAAAVAGTLFFCTMTEIACLGADALSDSAQILFLAISFWCLARYWCEPAVIAVAHPAPPVWLFGAGLASGAALLARPETLVFLPVVAGSLLSLQLLPHGRLPVPRLIFALSCLACGVVLILGPYLFASDVRAPQAAWGRLLGRDLIEQEATQPKPAAKAWRLADGQRMDFSLKETTTTSRFRGYASAVAEFCRELPEAFQYWIGALALWGAWCRRRQARGRFDFFVAAYFVAHSCCAIGHASSAGYLAPRHLLPIVLLGLGAAGHGACDLGGRLTNGWAPLVGPPRASHTLSKSCLLKLAACSIAILAALACLPRTLAPLHASRIAHRRAGEWLAAQPLRGTVLDTRGITGLYSGRLTQRYDVAKIAFRSPHLAYIVLEQRELDFASPRSRTLQHLLGGAAECVARFEGSRSAADAVLVYRWHPQRFTRQLRTGQRTT